MKNKRGQAGAIFIIIIPIIFIVLAFIYDNVMIIIANNKYNLASKEIAKEVLTNSYNDKAAEVKNLYEKNNYEVEMLNVSYDGTTLKIYNSHSYPSFFGNILGVKSYRTEINLEAHKEDDKIIIEEKEIEA